MTSFYFLFNAPCPPSPVLLCCFLIIYINSRMERLRVVVGNTSNKKRKTEIQQPLLYLICLIKKIMDHSTTFPICVLVNIKGTRNLCLFLFFFIFFYNTLISCEKSLIFIFSINLITRG